MKSMQGVAYRAVSLVGLCVLSLLGTSAPARTQDASPAEFTFGLFGDLGYSAAEEPLLDNLLSDFNRRRLDFLVHVGDLGRPRSGSCTNELWARRFAQFSTSANPRRQPLFQDRQTFHAPADANSHR
jgi:hypothetical protein